MISKLEVQKAAADIVAAFGSHNNDQYFSAFDPQATFIFHNTNTVLKNRFEYEKLWKVWESEGFHIISCESTQPLIQIISSEVAIFTHHVATQSTFGFGSTVTQERETIIFRLVNQKLLGIHEHLSLNPNFLSQ